MNEIRKSVTIPLKNKLIINYTKIKNSEMKGPSNFSPRKNKLIKLKTNYIENSNKKTPSNLFKNADLKLSELEQKKANELNNNRRSVAYQYPEKGEKQFKRLLNKKEEEDDKYLNYVKYKIYEKISKKYSSPYIYDLKDEESEFKKKPSESFTYYNYYLICNLIANKKCKFKSRYNEFVYYYNKQEYLIKYFVKNEIYIIMNYLVHILYSKDIATIVKNPKKLLTYNEIRTMFNNLVNNNYNFIGTMEIMKGIGVYYKHKGNNNPTNAISNLENIKPILGKNINYFFAKDIPSNQMPNCIPKYYLLEPEVIDYIKDFTEKRKYTKINRLDNNSQIVPKIKKKRQYYDSNKLKGNILTNISLFISKDKYDNDESTEMKQTKRKHNSYRRMKNDSEIGDVEIFVEKILGRYKDKINNYKKNTKKISRRIIRQRSKRMNSMFQVPLSHLKKKGSFFQSSKLLNIKALNVNQLNKKVFKTSLKHVGITTSKNIVRYIKKIDGNNLTLNKGNNNVGIYLNNNEEKKSFKKLAINCDLKYKTVKNRDIINKKRQKLIRFDGFKNEKLNLEQKISNKNSANNINSNSINNIKETSSNDSLFYHKIKNISKFLAQSNKNKYSINNYISLKKLNSFSTKNISIPKKVIYKGPSKKAFSTFSGMNFEDNGVNNWENNKIDTDIINVVVKTSFLLNRIGNSYNKNLKSFHNCNTLKKLIKCPLIYFSNSNK